MADHLDASLRSPTPEQELLILAALLPPPVSLDTLTAVSGLSPAGEIDLIAIEIVPLAGTPDLDLSQVVIELSDSTNKSLLRYSYLISLR